MPVLIHVTSPFHEGVVYISTSCALDRAQRLQNSAALLTCPIAFKRTCTPSLREINWLPIRERIHFKIALLGFFCNA